MRPLQRPLPPRPRHAVCHDRPARRRPAPELATAIALYRAMDMTFWPPQTEVALARGGIGIGRERRRATRRGRWAVLILGGEV